MCSFMLCEAQATSLTVDNQTPGWLSSKINYGDQQTVRDLTVSGFLNQDDLKFIGTLINNHNLRGHINLAKCQIIDKKGSLSNIFEENCFVVGGVNISNLSMPISLISAKKGCMGNMTIDTLTVGGPNMSSITDGISNIRHHLIVRDGVNEIGDDIFSSNDQLESVVLPKSLITIGKRAFKNSSSITDINLPDSIEHIGKDAFRETRFLPDTLRLPTALIEYNTTAFPLKYGQTVIIPESVVRIDNTYTTYNNTTNIWTTWDYIKNTSKYNWVMKSNDPPYVEYDYSKFLEGSTVYIPHNSYAVYSIKPPFSYTKLIEAKIVESVNVDPETLVLNVGENIKLNVSVLPLDAEDLSIMWSSSDPSIATVSENGTVTAISPGDVKIYAISNNNPLIKDFCKIVVIQPAIGISLNLNKLELVEDEASQLIATVLPENASNKNVNWTSSDISVAMVSQDGAVYAIKPGQATIMATTEDGGFVALCKVTVLAKEIIATDISLNKSVSTLKIGETLQLEALLKPENVTNASVSWISTDGGVASVSVDGLVNAVSEGQAQIMAKTKDGSNLTAVCDVTVEKAFVQITKIQVNPQSARVAVGETMNLDVEIYPSDATQQQLSWASTNTDVASVSENGVVSVLSEGDVIIIATTKDGSNLSSACSIHAYEDVVLVSDIVLDMTEIQGEESSIHNIRAVVIPENATNKRLTWVSSNEKVAMCEEGRVTLLKKGTAVIHVLATDGSGVEAECHVVVSDSSGLDSVITDSSTFVKIYNLNGILIFEGLYAEANLSPGFYIVLCDGNAVKLDIR